jgi:glutamine---fructose-6-phosphate transaminase (isomerizing)
MTRPLAPSTMMHREMDQQPDVIRGLLQRSAHDAQMVEAIQPTKPVGVVVIARGSSLNAGTYLAYAIETLAGIPVSLARPSVFTRYGATPNFHGWLAISLSQSGRTPEIVDASETIVACGAKLITVTNDPDSPLAQLSQFHYNLAAGPEQAVPATKTVSAQMVSALIIAAALGNVSLSMTQALEQLPSAINTVLGDPAPVDRLGHEWAHRPGLTVLGRGFGFAAAHEIALKVREVAGILGEAWSVTAFKHGPIAGLSSEVPVLITSMTPTLDSDTTDVVAQLTARGNPIAVCAPNSSAEIGISQIVVDSESLEFADELITPILAVVRGQQLCGAMASALGVDPDKPQGLNKVTLTH